MRKEGRKEMTGKKEKRDNVFSDRCTHLLSYKFSYSIRN